MSRSVKKSPVMSMANASSEKQDKQAWHRKLRHKEKIGLASAQDIEAYMGSDEREVSSPYVMAKDGKRYLGSTEVNGLVKMAKEKSPEDSHAADRMRHKIVAK